MNKVKLKIAGIAQANTQTGKIDKAYALVALNAKTLKPQPTWLPKVQGKMYVTIYVGAAHQNIKVGDEVECFTTLTGSYETENGIGANILVERRNARNADTANQVTELTLGTFTKNQDAIAKLPESVQAAMLGHLFALNTGIVTKGKADSATRLGRERLSFTTETPAVETKLETKN